MEDPSVELAQEAREMQHLSGAMAKLQGMHSQLRELRDTVPSLIRPMRGVNNPPEVVYAEFMKAARKAVDDTRDFAVVMKAKTSQDVLSEARSSKLKNPHGIMAWLADQQDDWPQKSLVLDMKADSGFLIQDVNGTPMLGREEALQSFKASHLDADISLAGDEQEIVFALPPNTGIVFRIKTRNADAKQPDYTVICRDSSDQITQSKLHTEITQALTSRPKQYDLLYTLEILHSYSDLMSRACSTCNRLIDAYGAFPIYRQQDFVNASIQFQALHEGCLAV